MGAKTLLIDLDGTLVRQSFWVQPHFTLKALLRVRKIIGTWAALKYYFVSARAFRAKNPGLSNAERVRTALANELKQSKESIEASIREIEHAIFPEMQRYFRPVPEAQQFIEWAKSRYRLILATNPIWTLGPINLRVKWAGIDPGIFEYITHSEVMTACKPNVEYYEQILKRQSLDPKDCIMIGNERTNDGNASKLGIRTFILGYDGTFGDLQRSIEAGSL